MDEENQREQLKMQSMQIKYLTGRQSKNGSAFNPITLQYDETPEGMLLKQRDEDAKVR